jgi:hypothetical protein
MGNSPARTNSLNRPLIPYVHMSKLLKIGMLIKKPHLRCEAASILYERQEKSPALLLQIGSGHRGKFTSTNVLDCKLQKLNGLVA